VYKIRALKHARAQCDRHSLYS